MNARNDKRKSSENAGGSKFNRKARKGNDRLDVASGAEEAMLLESVGGSIKLMDTYESSVIKEATLSSAPRLAGEGVGLGFPDLAPLGPSYRASLSSNNNNKKKDIRDLPHIRTILKRTRTQIQQLERQQEQQDSRELDKLYMKEQMLLFYLQSRIPLEEMPIQGEIDHENKRRIRCKTQREQHQEISDSSKSILDSMPSQKRARINSSSKNKNTESKNPNALLSSTERLEMIKQNGQLPRDLASASTNLHPAILQMQSRRKRSRTSMMDHKRIPNPNQEENNQDENKNIDGDDLGHQVELLRKKRQQRQKQRQKRRNQTFQQRDDLSESDSDHDQDETDQQNDDEKKEIDNDGQKGNDNPITIETEHDDHEKMSPEDQISNESNEKQVLNDVTDAASGPTTELAKDGNDDSNASKTVKCPLCELCLPIAPDEEDVDAFLSRHIETCQQQQQERQQSVGRRLRPRKAATPSKDSDHGSDSEWRDTDGEDNDSVDPNKTSKNEPTIKDKNDKPKSKRQSKNRNVGKKSKPSKKKGKAPTQQPSPTTSPALDDLEEWVYEDRVDEWIESGLTQMKDMSERDANEKPPGMAMYPGNFQIPAWMNNRLFPYQRTGVRWMWELHQQEAGGVVGDEMGLGKTVQVCSFLGAMAASRKLRSALIISPATMLVHWLKELAVWAPGLRRVLIHKSGEVDGISRSISCQLIKVFDKWIKRSRADRLYEPIDQRDLEEFDPDRFCGTGYVFVTTYENIRREPDVWTSHKWGYVVLDEGQKIRNPDADVTLACKRIKTPHRLLLSGTPIQNDLRELWSLFDFVFPGRLGTLPTFETEFADPVKRGGYSNASPVQVQLAYRCALVLKDLINPYLLRRRKREVKEVSRMPGKTEQVLFCRLSQRQRSLYEAYIKSDEVLSILRGSTQLFKSITILRKICNHPDLVCDPSESTFENFVREVDKEKNGGGDEDDDDDDDNDSKESMDESDVLVERAGKLQVLAKILPLWKEQGHRVLIFCQWRKMLNLIERFTRFQGWKFSRLDGNTSVASRQKLVDQFNSDESFFGMLMTTRTGGVGLNLTGADRIILYDPDWNPQTDAQARERAWRFGQKRSVTVYRLITAGTIEEKIYQRQIFKTALTNSVLQNPQQRRLFSQRDLRDFFTLKADDGSIVKGGQGVTELGQMTKGQGIVDPDALPDKEKEGNKDDNTTLETVMKSKGLAGVFDHDFVESDSTAKKSSTVQEMEEQAKKVAQESLRALQASTRIMQEAASYCPTWTGSNGGGSRFGHGSLSTQSLSRNSNGMKADAGFGGADTAGFVGGKRGMGSRELLAGLKKNNNQSDNDKNGNGEYVSLLLKIKKFIAHFKGGPSTDDLLKEFSSIPNSEAAIFRRLLTSVARLERGKWRIKEE